MPLRNMGHLTEQPIPPPMLSGNWDQDTICRREEALRRMAGPGPHEGWEWITGDKPGFRTNTIGGISPRLLICSNISVKQ